MWILRLLKSNQALCTFSTEVASLHHQIYENQFYLEDGGEVAIKIFDCGYLTRNEGNKICISIKKNFVTDCDYQGG